MRNQTFILAMIFLGLFLVSCDKTPSDAHRQILPQLANELISTGTTSRISGLTPEILHSLKLHSSENLGYILGPPALKESPTLINSESGITLYNKVNGKIVLAIGLALNSGMDGYRLDGFYLADP